jgi:hypothetical protein
VSFAELSIFDETKPGTDCQLSILKHMLLSDQLHSIQFRMDDARHARRFASAVGRRNEAQYLDLELDNLECEQAELMERIAEMPT